MSLFLQNLEAKNDKSPTSFMFTLTFYEFVLLIVNLVLK